MTKLAFLADIDAEQSAARLAIPGAIGSIPRNHVEYLRNG